VLTNEVTGEVFWIEPETLYALDLHDPHTLEARNDMRLLCVFNPPLIGQELHKQDGSY
jgi:L-ectoine synthase